MQGTSRMEELAEEVIVDILNKAELTAKELMQATLVCHHFKDACESGPLVLRNVSISSRGKADSFREFLSRVQAVLSLEVSWAPRDEHTAADSNERLLSLVRTPSVHGHLTQLSLCFPVRQYNVWGLEKLSRALSGVSTLHSLTLSCGDFMGLETELDVDHLPEQAVGPFASLSNLTVRFRANRGLIDLLQYFPAVSTVDLDAGLGDHIWSHNDILIRSDALQHVRLRSMRVGLSAKNLRSVVFHGASLAFVEDCDIDVLNVIHGCPGFYRKDLRIEVLGGSRVTVERLLIGKEEGQLEHVEFIGNIRARCLEVRAPLASSSMFYDSMTALVQCSKTIKFGTEAFGEVGAISGLRNSFLSTEPLIVENMEIHVGPISARLLTFYEELARRAEGRRLVFINHNSKDLGGASEARCSTLSPLVECQKCQSRSGNEVPGSSGTRLCPCE